MKRTAVGCNLRAMAALLSLLAVGTPSWAAEEGVPNGIVTFTFDDASRGQYEFGLSIAEAHGVTGTLFVPTGLIAPTSSSALDGWTMNEEEVRAFVAAGWELGAHGDTHRRLTELDGEERTGEIVRPIAAIEEWAGTKPVSFSSPFGAFDDSTIAEIMEHYRYQLSWKGHGGRNPIGAVDQNYIGRFEITRETSSETVCGEMVRAALNHVWLVLLVHDIVEENPDVSQISARHFEEVVACADLLADKGVVRILTIRDAMGEIEAKG